MCKAEQCECIYFLVVHLICDICAAEVKVNWLFWFLCVDLTHSHYTTLLQKQRQWVTIPSVAHFQDR